MHILVMQALHQSFIHGQRVLHHPPRHAYCSLPRPPSKRGTVMEASDTSCVINQIPDAHSHPQLDGPNLLQTLQLQSPHVAAMGVAVNVDWQAMSLLAAFAGSKVLPGFGIHPWWAHLHGSSLGATWPQLLEAPSDDQLQTALQLLKERQDANQVQHHKDCKALAAAQALLQQQQQQEAPSPAGSSTRMGPSSEAAGHGEEAGPPAQPAWHLSVCDAGLAVVPVQQWEEVLVQQLQRYPHAFVGEIGIDKAAVIPGSKARTKLQHQLELMERQLAIAAAHGRPVSCHCVRGYGHLLQLFSGMRPQQCPPKVMLHSYGGSPEEIPRYCKLKGIGDRFYFSFSTAINARTPEKLRARIAAVPDDRLLLESDQVTPLEVDAGLLAICRVVAEVKGWSLEEAAQRGLANFRAFYSDQLAAAAKMDAAPPTRTTEQGRV